MSRKSLLIPLSLFVLLSACAMGNYPNTLDGYRAAMKDNPNMIGVRVENFTINRSMSRSARFVRRKGEECLRHTIRRTSRTSSGGINTSYSDNLVKYEPKAKISKTRSSVYLSETYMNLKGKVTHGPYFTFLLDLTPVSRNKTKVDLYYTWGEPRPTIVKAVKAWAKGKDVGCPNLAKT